MAGRRRQKGKPQGRQADHFTQKAQREGYAARSVYKLQEIDERWNVVRKGGAVLDLGCSPGSWTKYAANKVGPQGRVRGYDLKPVAADMVLPPHAETMVQDIFELPTAEDASFDTVLSDMAPATMGDHKTDALRSMALAESALAIAQAQLCSGGCFVVKLLEGGDVPDFVKMMRECFSKVERLRPKATRKVSTEIFVIGLGFRG